MYEWITITAYPWIKALHVIAVISWMAGMLYLPRLFVYHCDAGSDRSSRTSQGDWNAAEGNQSGDDITEAGVICLSGQESRLVSRQLRGCSLLSGSTVFRGWSRMSPPTGIPEADIL